MRITDTSAGLPSVFSDGSFDIEKWKAYMDASLPGAKELCLRDAAETIDAGYSWEDCFLPILNAVFLRDEKRREAIRSFREASADLDQRIKAVFGKTVDAAPLHFLFSERRTTQNCFQLLALYVQLCRHSP